MERTRSQVYPRSAPRRFGGIRFCIPTNVDTLERRIITGSIIMEPMVGQIELFAFSFAPVGFLPCNGKTTFALPTLAPITPQGPGYYIAIFGVAPPTQ
jgi:hypothetical protein